MRWANVVLISLYLSIRRHLRLYPPGVILCVLVKADRQQVSKNSTTRNRPITVDSGGLVTEVASGGPAEKAGIKPKDVITAVGSTKMKDVRDLIAALRDHKPGDSVTLTINRNGKQSKVDLTLGDRRY